MFDVRKSVNTWVLDFFKKCFVQEVLKRNLTVYVIVGNHDIHYRETLDVNTPSLVLSEWDQNFFVVKEPKNIHLEDGNFLLVPWITKNNKKQVEDAIKETNASYLCGHFEFNGFPMHRGSNAKTHHEHVSYGKFKGIFSGHFHTMSQKDNVIYTGTPYETTWIDAGDPKGWFLFDHGDWSFVENQHKIHVFAKYPEIIDTKGKFVRAILDGNPDKKEAEAWKKKLEEQGPIDIKYQEKMEESFASEVNMEKIMSTEELIFEFIDDSDIQADKTKVKQHMSSIYSRALGDKDVD